MAETAKTLGNLSSDPDSEISNVEYLTLPGRKKRVLLSSINQRDRSGRSLLYKCAGQGLSEAVKVLCEAGAQVNIKDNAGWSPLHEATVNGHEIVVKYLLEAGANVNCQGGNLDTPLHDAVESGHLGVVDLLLSHGASLELKNENSQTANDVATSQNIVQLLNEWKVNTAKVLTRYEDGKTLLHKAVSKGSVGSILDCLKYGSDINARDNSAWTPLHEACLLGNVEIVQVLLLYGAEIQPMALDKDTPLHQACANNFLDVVKLLLEYGADPNRADAHGRTPMDLTVLDSIKEMLLAPKENYTPHKTPKYLPRLAETIEEVSEESKQEEMTEDASVMNEDFRPASDISFASSREERKFQALLKKLAQNEEKSSTKSGNKDPKRFRKFEDDFYSSSSDSENIFNMMSKKSKNQEMPKSASPEKKLYTGKPRGRKPKNASIGSSTEVDAIILGDASESKPEGSPRRGRPPKNPSQIGRPRKQNSVDLDSQAVQNDETESNETREEYPDVNTEIKVESSPKKRGRKPKSWHIQNQKLEQQRQLEKLNSENNNPINFDSQTQEIKSVTLAKSQNQEEIVKKEVESNSHKIAEVQVTSQPPVSAPVVNIHRGPVFVKSPPAPVFVSPVIRKKAKKKSWVISGYQSLESPHDHQIDNMEFIEEESSQAIHEDVNLSQPINHNNPLQTFYKKNCLPLYIITLPSSQSRYFLDIQLGLFLQYSSGRIFLDSNPGLLTRIAATAEKQYLEQSAVSETIYNSMLNANESAARWIKTVPLRAGHVGLKMTDLDIHFVREEDVRSRLNPRIEELQHELEGDQVKFFDDIFIGGKEEIGHDRRNLKKSPPAGGYVHKLKRHANKKVDFVFDEVIDSFDEIPQGLWVDRYSPISTAELSVHKKKVDAVRNLLSDAFDKCQKRLPGFKIIVLKGPSGVGKMSTLRCLGREMGFTIHEWIDQTTLFSTISDENARPSASKSTLFKEYLRSAFTNKLRYGNNEEALSTNAAQKRLLVVKDLPNLSNAMSKSAFHENIIEFTQYAKIPLVFILTDMKSHSFSKSELHSYDELISLNSVLPQSIRNSKFYAQINFNVTAPSILLKALKRIVALEYRRGKKGPTAEQLEYLSNLGDIRKAINHLQFRTFQPLIKSKGKKILGQEPSAVLFHALGEKELIYNLPGHLKHHTRKEWNDGIQPEQLITLGHLESDMVSLFLQENYPTYYTSIDDIESLTDYMSFADLFSVFKVRNILEPYEISIMMRSILFCNQSESIQSIGFQKHFKPQTWDCWRKSQSLNVKIRDKFMDRQERCSFSSMSQLQLPYECLINPGSKYKELATELNYFPTRRKNIRFSGQIVEDDEDLMIGNDYRLDNPSIKQHSNVNTCSWLVEDEIID